MTDEIAILRKQIEQQNRLFADNSQRPEPTSPREPSRDDATTQLSLRPPPSAPPRQGNLNGFQEDDRKLAQRPGLRQFARPNAQPPEFVKSNRTVPVPEPALAPTVPPVMQPRTDLPSVPASPEQDRDPRFRNQGQSVVSSATTQVDPLRESLVQRVKDHPTDIAAHLALQLFLFLKEEQTPDLEMLASLPAEHRDMLVNLLNGLTNFRQTVQVDPDALPSRIVGPLLKMSDLMREQTELTIPVIKLCRVVDGYGEYQPLEPTFEAGIEREAIIYCEIDNFSSRQNEQQLWETDLAMEAVLYNSVGDAILKGKDKVPTDLCRNRRRDFFVVKRLRLPASLAASRYILKITIVDEQAKRVAENTLTIMMMAQQGTELQSNGG